MKHGMRMERGMQRKCGGSWRRWLAGVLAAAMLGPMFGFTEDDLVRLRARSRQAPTEPDKKPARISLYGALLLALEDPAEDPFTEKVKDFYAHLTALRQMARSAPAEQLLEEIFASTGYLAALGAVTD